MNTLANVIASRLAAIENCRQSGNAEWEARHAEYVAALVREHMPSGGGFDCGTKLDMDASRPECLRFTTQFHHMDENGCYDGWTSHAIIVRPSLVYGLDIRVMGRDRNGIKEYIAECFDSALRGEVSA